MRAATEPATFASILRVADDWLVSLDTNRYSVPFRLIGQPVEVHRRNGTLRIFHRGALVAEIDRRADHAPSPDTN